MKKVTAFFACFFLLTIASAQRTDYFWVNDSIIHRIESITVDFKYSELPAPKGYTYVSKGDDKFSVQYSRLVDSVHSSGPTDKSVVLEMVKNFGTNSTGDTVINYEPQVSYSQFYTVLKTTRTSVRIHYDNKAKRVYSVRQTDITSEFFPRGLIALLACLVVAYICLPKRLMKSVRNERFDLCMLGSWGIFLNVVPVGITFGVVLSVGIGFVGDLPVWERVVLWFFRLLFIFIGMYIRYKQTRAKELSVVAA